MTRKDVCLIRSLKRKKNPQARCGGTSRGGSRRVKDSGLHKSLFVSLFKKEEEAHGEIYFNIKVRS